MTEKCAYHPDRVAQAQCAECHAPICGECQTLVAGKPVCNNCVEKIRARVPADIGASSGPVDQTGAAPTYSSPASTVGQVASAPQPQVVIAEPANPARLLLGIVAVAIVAI